MNQDRPPARLFVMGAGASYGAGLPDASRVLSHLVGYTTGPWMPVANRSPMSFFGPLVGPLIEVVGRLGGGERFPLEEVAADFHNAARRDIARFGPLLAMLYQAIRELIYSRSCERASEFNDFAASLRLGDLVLSFNWDMCLELAMAAQHVPFTRSFAISDNPGTVRLIKFHGSVDDLIVPLGAKASIGPHSIIEPYGATPPAPAPGWPAKYELVRLLTYDLPLEGELAWDKEKRKFELRIIGEREPVPREGYADLFPFQLERMLGDSSPFLFTPATPRLLYDWMYDVAGKTVAGVQRPISSIFVVGYSFPGYDAPVFKVLSAMARHFGLPPAHIVNPAAGDIPRNVFEEIFGAVELHLSTFGDFNWAKA